MAAVNASATLSVCSQLPSGLLEVTPENLHLVVSTPTLIHLPGRVPDPLFVSILLHGNETTGLHAVQRLLSGYSGQCLPRALSLFIGNVAATSLGRRRIDGQVDYNRIWPGHVVPASAETRMARSVCEEMARRKPYASVDVHNNTGTNPHYACVSRLDPKTLQLAAMFGRRCIHSTHPRGTLSAAFAELCPSVTLECGKPDFPLGVDHACEYLDACLRLSNLPTHPVPGHDLELYESVGQVLIRDDVNFGFDDPAAALNLIPNLDRWNFSPVPAGFTVGFVRSECLPIQVIDDWGQDVAGQFFVVDRGRLVARRELFPAMLTTDARIVRQDCLGYLMQRLA
jgi:hypothetical protein